MFSRLSAPQVERKPSTVFKTWTCASNNVQNPEYIEVWMVKYFDCMLNTEFLQVMQLCILKLCSLIFFPQLCFFLSIGVYRVTTFEVLYCWTSDLLRVGLTHASQTVDASSQCLWAAPLICVQWWIIVTKIWNRSMLNFLLGLLRTYVTYQWG